MSKEPPTLEATLHAIDDHLRAHRPNVLASLRPAATVEAQHRLAALFGGEAPAELVTWFTVHDGQHDHFGPV